MIAGRDLLLAFNSVFQGLILSGDSFNLDITMDGSHSDDSRLDRTIGEFVAEVLQVIVSSRSPSSSIGASSVPSRDGRFNLQIGDRPVGLENIGGASCGYDAGTMVVDVILVKRSLPWPSKDSSPRTPLTKIFSSAEKSGDQNNGKVIERWVLHHDVGKGEDSGKYKKWSRSNTVSMVHERLMLLLRSLYVMVRLLPAYKTTRGIASSHHSCLYYLAHRVSSFAEPFNNKEDEALQRFGFAPVDIMNGRLCLSVLYHASVLDFSSYPSVPISPRIIPNYIGRAFGDPLKRLSLPPVAHLHKPTLIRTGSVPVSAIPRPPLDGVGHGSNKTKRSARAIKNGPVIKEVVSGKRDGSIDKLRELIPSGSFGQLSFIKCRRQSSWQDFDNAEITCPFDIDDDYNLSDFSHRSRSSNGQGHERQHGNQGSATSGPNRKSQDAFVGALVDMLKRAPPLREELQHLVNLPRPSDTRTVLPKTTADAMEELKSYRKMKCLLPGP